MFAPDREENAKMFFALWWHRLFASGLCFFRQRVQERKYATCSTHSKKCFSCLSSRSSRLRGESFYGAEKTVDEYTHSTIRSRLRGESFSIPHILRIHRFGPVEIARALDGKFKGGKFKGDTHGKLIFSPRKLVEEFGIRDFSSCCLHFDDEKK